jgi:hypothetical protein
MGKIPSYMPQDGGYAHMVDEDGNTVQCQDGIVLIDSAVLTQNTNSQTQKNTSYRGVRVHISPGTFGSGATAIQCTIKGYDPTSNTWYTILQSADLADSTFAQLHVYPGIAASNNVTANDVLPRQWRVELSATDWGTGGSTVGVSCALEL